MASKRELVERKAIRGFRSGPNVLIVARAIYLSSPGDNAKIVQRPERIPEHRDTVRIFHADGEDDLKIESSGGALTAYTSVVGTYSGDAVAAGGDEATGVSKKLSVDDAPQPRSPTCRPSLTSIPTRWSA